MNAKQLIAAVAVFAAAGSAMADSTGNFTDFVNLSSTRSRADVTAELSQARSANSYVAGGREFIETTNQFAGANQGVANTAVAAAPSKSRAEVVAELKQARADGTYVMGGEEYVSPIAVVRNGRSRTEVRSEAIASQRAKKLTTVESGS